VAATHSSPGEVPMMANHMSHPTRSDTTKQEILHPSQVSPLEEHEDFILGLIKEQPDMTLDEIVAAMKKAKIAASRTAVWRFLRPARHYL
jgi:transposase